MLNYIEQDAELIRESLPAGTSVPDDSESLFLMYAVLMRAKGVETQATDVHDAWSAWMVEIDRGHESIRPFEELDTKTKAEDSPFLLAIRRVATTRIL